MRSLVRELLQLGFKPTQIGDSIAIATGGATYYRNRVNRYQKQGLNRKDAIEKAWNDFQDTTQSTQQSSRPDMVSQQQSSWKGKIILNFQNITSQYNRFGKKAMSDIYNRRISPPYTTQLQSDIGNASKIAFYFGIQNMIFYSLQTALFAMMFEDDENEERWLKKKERVLNGSIDSILRGSGIGGAVLSTLKNMAIKFAEQREKGYNPDESAVLMEMLNFSPVVGIKARKITNAEKTLFYNKNVIKEMDTFDINNPMWSAYTNYIEAGTNLPLNRLYNKTRNIRQALNNEHEAWKRVMMSFGWSQYNLGIQDESIKEVKETIKTKKKIEQQEKKEQKKKEKILEKYPGLDEKEIQVKLKSKEMFDLSKEQQYYLLKELGYSENEILDLKKEQNRADKIAELYYINLKTRRETNQNLIDNFIKNPKSLKIKKKEKKEKGFGDGKYERRTYTREAYTR